MKNPISKEEYIKCLSSEHSLFKVLSKLEFELLCNHITFNHFKKNEIIYREGDMPMGLLCLCFGKVKIFKEGVGGRDQIIRLEKPVSFIGFRALFADENYIASAIAIEECAIVVIEKDVLKNLIKKNGVLGLSIIKAIATELGVSNERTVSLTQKHVRARLAESLLFLLEKFGFEEDMQTLSVCLPREDIASLSNMTTSNAIRTLSSFASEGLISLDGRKIKILNSEELENISTTG